ncbi:E3 ubiquitin-protein ligase TRIM31-like isoform X2 [Ochotona princeps]|uniref:E3 ubiquitin-protein ligase TRIM31-like isoform X2 n=1 Tax=Ochotona princeps TaxID=9978 RepID=UPI0027149157|nr:E3 ubiquitin-protein ligase TRIM31-like isoform X2 [Ochotona princeps]XP_058522675.1 E3 ubiquitin-protein ligase TRIM31-like isoform X2 [Ochotona princeps]
MASQHFPSNMQQEVTCPICLDILQDPVTIGCGHNFCRGCITQLGETCDNFLQCPLCKRSMRKDAFASNWLLGSLVERIQTMDLSEMRLEEEQLRCPKHRKKLYYFCEEDGKLLCAMCHESNEHKYYNTSTMEEAAQHHQEQIQWHIEILEQKEQLLTHMKAEDEERISVFTAQVEFQKQRIHTEFKNLQQVLEEEKNFLLFGMEWLEEKGAQERECYSADIQAQLISLKDLLDALKAKQQMPSRQLLEDIKDTLQRCEEFQFQFHSTTPVPLDLEKKLSEAESRYDFIIENLRKFREQLQADRMKHHECLFEENNPNMDRS